MARVTTKKPMQDRAITMTVSLPISMYERVMKKAHSLKIGRSVYIQQLIEADK